jgi:hypothetical protein
MNENSIVMNYISPKNTRKYTVFTIETILEQRSRSSTSENSSSEEDEKAEKIEIDVTAQNEQEKLKKRSRTSFLGKVHRQKKQRSYSNKVLNLLNPTKLQLLRTNSSKIRNASTNNHAQFKCINC